MPGKWDNYRQRAEAMGVDAKQRWLTAGEDHASVGVIEGCYRRDQAAFGTVLGSAIALRLFLFIIPAYVMIISLVNVLRLGDLFSHYLQSSVITSSMAVAMDGTTWWHSLWLFLSFAVFSAWAGKSLARVLATTSGLSWGSHDGRVQAEDGGHRNHGGHSLRHRVRQLDLQLDPLRRPASTCTSWCG